jgi:hypothetical protein
MAFAQFLALLPERNFVIRLVSGERGVRADINRKPTPIVVHSFQRVQLLSFRRRLRARAQLHG